MRPQTLDQFQGKSNSDIVERLRIAIMSAKERKTALSHVLLYGSAGVGKSTLAGVIANEMDSKLIVRTGGSIAKQTDLFSVLYEIDLLQTVGKEAILFFDEIHKLSVDGMPEEMFYSLLEDFIFYSSLSGKKVMLNGEENIIKCNAFKTDHPFTIIGATTAPGMLQKPLRDRFEINCYLKTYSASDLIQIVKFHAEKESISIDEVALLELAKRARGTPRVAISFLHSCRDRMIYEHNEKITGDIVEKEMSLQSIYEDGLTELDLRILRILADTPKGMGIRTLAGVSNIDPTTLSEMIFPFLAASELVKTTSKRFITEKGLERLKQI